MHSKLELNEIKNFDHTKNKKGGLDNLLQSNSLFSKINLIIIKNPQESLVEELRNFKNSVNILIINGEGIKSISKIKKYFDSHQAFLSVPCYDLNKNSIKKQVLIKLKESLLALDLLKIY